ncbi:hypothetical protein E1287_15835 [Actinomadura sp. KC06]|uniref:hypothetical protein n=1 Tax=Actinomadura sp. KC06 TaxID=2530369 RepID=UPI00104E0103|nr:hypothetical protein [Actinomadura sp. KC06]TDD34664.1 hypothetical protein E1287_15835 [Actinomadura sp. KC06]
MTAAETPRRKIDRLAGAALIAVVVGGCVIPFGLTDDTTQRVAVHHTVLGLSSAVVAAGAALLVADRQRHAALAVMPLAVAPALVTVSDAQVAPFLIWLITFPIALGAAIYATAADRTLKLDPIAAMSLAVIEVGIGYQFQGMLDASPYFRSADEQLGADGRRTVYLACLAIAAAAGLLLADGKRGPALAVLPLAVFPATMVAIDYTSLKFGDLLGFAAYFSLPLALGAGIYALFSRRRRGGRRTFGARPRPPD